MPWVQQSVTAKQSGGNTVAVNYPSGLQVGDTVFLLCSRGFGSAITYTASDFTSLVSRNTQCTQQIWYRVVDGTEGATSSVSSSSAGSSTFCMARFTGGPNAANFAASIVATNNAGAAGTVGLNYTSLTIGQNRNCLVLSASAKQASLTSFDIPSPFTGELVHSITSDGGQSFVWDYAIQTDAANIVGANYVVAGDATAPAQTIICAILPAPVLVWPRVTFHPGRSPGQAPQSGRFFQPPRAMSTPSTDASVALVGQVATFTAGLLTPDTVVPLVGQPAVFTAGILAPNTTVPLIGALSTFAAGTLTPATTVPLVGQPATFTAGTLAPSTTVPLTGAAAVFVAGTVTPGITMSLSGQGATFAAGLLTPSTSVPFTGALASFSAGTLAPSTQVGLTGQPALFTPGIVTPGISVSITGLAATFAPGSMTPSAALTITGQRATFTPGQLSPSGGDPVSGGTIHIVGFIANVGTLMGRQ